MRFAKSTPIAHRKRTREDCAAIMRNTPMRVKHELVVVRPAESPVILFSPLTRQERAGRLKPE